MRFRYYIRVLEIPSQAEHLWGNNVNAAPDASYRTAMFLQRHHIDRCFVTEFAATVDGAVGSRDRQYGFRTKQIEHVRALASVYADWFVVARPARLITASSGLDDFHSGTVLLRREPDMQSLIDYELAEKRHLLKVRYGRPTTPPQQPVLVNLFGSGRHSNFGLCVDMLAEYGGIAFFEHPGGGDIVIVTWSYDPVGVWLARWQAAVAQPDDVSIVDHVPIA